MHTPSADLCRAAPAAPAAAPAAPAAEVHPHPRLHPRAHLRLPSRCAGTIVAMTVVLMVTVMAGSCRQCAAQDFKPNFYCTDNPCNDVSYEVSGETGCPHTDHACLCVDEAFVESFPAGCECRDGLTRTVDTSGTSPSGFVCGPCTVCDHFHIKASPCMPEQDTVCVNCATACEPGAYVDACGSSSVACEPCTSCEAQSQFEAAPCTSTSDTLCCDACADAEQFVAEPCTRTTAATCTACTRCVDGLEFELRACGLTTDRVCQACTTTCAGPHEHVVTPCTPTSDAQCGCRPGYFESVPETPTSSRECIPCPQGTTDHDRDGTTACMACPFAITNTTANTGSCEELQCAPGTSGSQSCQPCAPPSHYQPLGGQTMCLNTTLCRPGFVEEQPPTPTTDRVCVACGHGTFSNVTADGAGSCVNWRTCAVLTEQYILGDGTSSTDRACAALTPCTPSQFEQQPPTRFHDRVCANISAPCDVGSTEYEAAQSTATSDRVCRPIRHCNVTQFELASPASTSNRQCQACRACAGDEVEVRPCTLTQDRACEELRIVLLRPDNGSTIPSNRFVVEANANGQFVPPVGQLQPSLPPNTSIVFVQPAMSTTNSISIAFPSADQTIAYAVMRDGVPVVQRTVIIVVVDTTPPFFVFMPPALVLEAATLPRPATLVSNIAVHDAVDGDITPLPTAIRVDTSGVVLDEPGQYSALYWSDVTDAAGNALPPTPRTVIVADTMPPVLAAVFAGVPFAWNTTVMHEGATPFPYPTVTATDALDGAIPPASINRTDTPVAVAAAGPAGASVRVSYSVRDAAGNTAVEGFTVIIVDTTPPVIETPRTGQRVHVLFGSDAVRRVRVDIRAVDAVDGDVSSLAVVVLPTSPPIDTHVPGAHPVRIRARDNSGNTQAVGITLVIDPLVPPARKRRVLVVAVETRPRAPLQMLERELEQTLDLNANTAVILSATDPATTAASSDISDASINSSGKTGLSAGSVLFEVGVRMNAMSAAWRDLQFLRDRLRNLHTLNGTRVLFSRVGNMTTYPSQPPSSSSSSSSSQSAAVIAGTAGALAFVCIVTTVVIGLRRRMAGAKSTVHTLPPSPTAAATTTTPTAAEGVVGSSVCRLERNPAYEESSITMNFNPLYMPTHVMGQEAMIDESSSDAEPHYNTLRLPTRTHTAKTNSVQYDTLGASRTTAANCADDDEDGNYIEVSQGVEGDDEAEEVVGFAIPGTADVNQEQPVYTDMTPASLSGLDAAGEYVVPARGDTEETVYSTAHTSTATSADISGVCILDNTARYHATKHDGGRQTLQR